MFGIRKFPLKYNNHFIKRCVRFIFKTFNHSYKTDLKMENIVPPLGVRGMKELDRQQFTIKKSIPTLILNSSNVNYLQKNLKKYYLKLDNFKPIQPPDDTYKSLYNLKNENDDYRLVYLNPSLIQNWSDFDNDTLNELRNYNVPEDNFLFHQINITYDNWKLDEIIKAILPVDKEVAASYTLIGHIAHLNLRDHNLEYKNIIGQVMLDKIKLCKTVVNKIDIINSTYRNFQMEILSGENNFVTSVKENNCSFDLDFSEVYWNTRLSTEHERIVKIISNGDILFDIFAGIGPFAIPAAKKRCFVYANDLNPESYKWLKHNAKKNKISEVYFNAYNLDGADFINNDLRNFLIELLVKNSIEYNFDNSFHITMNLPAIAVTFLKNFIGLLSNVEVNEDSLDRIKIIVYVYCFVGIESREEAAKKLVEQYLGFRLDDKDYVSFVRSTAPNKDMMRVTFRLTKEMLLHNASVNTKRKHSIEQENEPNKRSNV